MAAGPTHNSVWGLCEEGPSSRPCSDTVTPQRILWGESCHLSAHQRHYNVTVLSIVTSCSGCSFTLGYHGKPACKIMSNANQASLPLMISIWGLVAHKSLVRSNEIYIQETHLKEGTDCAGRGNYSPDSAQEIS